MREKVPHIWNALWIAVLAGINFSPAIASIGFGLIAAIGVWQLYLDGKVSRLLPFLLLAFVLFFLELINNVDTNKISKKLLLYLPWFLLPAMTYSFNKFKDYWKSYIVFWVLPSVWIVLASIGYFISDYKFYSQMVLESKPIPLFSEVYHIEFSFLVTIQIFLLYVALRDRVISTLGGTKFLWVLWAILVIGIHVLSTRTGLLAFWIGMFYIFVKQGKTLNIKPHYIIMGLVALVSAAVFIPSLRNRIVNTWEDISAVVSGDDLNHKSFGQRWEAWQASRASWADDFINGVGSSSLNEAMSKGFEKNNTDLNTTNQITPHNQYLQWGLEFGIIGLIAWLLSISIVFRNNIREKSWSGLLVIGLIAIIFESLFERQAGMVALILLVGIVESTSVKK